MTIQQGSLDYLYYNGILDHIPYEAYSMPTLGQGACYQPAYDPKYLDNAKQGYAYQYDRGDYFMSQNPVVLRDNKKAPLQECKGFLSETKNKIVSIPTTIKGLIAGSVVLGTMVCLIKRVFHK